jgi:hypothetical protein
MAGQSTHNDKCPNSSLQPKGPHLFQVDQGDKHFKICQWCDVTVYRTDDELMKGIV